MQQILSYRDRKKGIFLPTHFKSFQKGDAFCMRHCIFLVARCFACIIVLHLAGRFSRFGYSWLCEIHRGAWIARGRLSKRESESVIVIESESESVSAFVKKAAYAKKIFLGVVGWLSLFRDVSLYWKTLIHQSNISLLFLYILFYYCILCSINWWCHKWYQSRTQSW